LCTVSAAPQHISFVFTPSFLLNVVTVSYFLDRVLVKPGQDDRNNSTQHISTLLAQHLKVPAKRTQHLQATYPNTVGHNMLRASRFIDRAVRHVSVRLAILLRRVGY